MWGGHEVCPGSLGDSRSQARPSPRVGNPSHPTPPPHALHPAPGTPCVEGAGDGGPAPPPARGLARAHPSRPGPAARGLAGPRGCSWALLETSNAGSDSSPTARMQEPPLPAPLPSTPPRPPRPSQSREAEQASQRASRRESGRRTGLQLPSGPRTRRTDKHTVQGR